MHHPSQDYVTQLAQYNWYHMINLYEPRTYDYREKTLFSGYRLAPTRTLQVRWTYEVQVCM
jgi:hypothetical protein